MSNDQNYDEYSIVSMSGQEHIRTRPLMYFRLLNQDALHEICYALVAHPVQEALYHHADRLHVVLSEDCRLTVSDNGLGMRIERHKPSQKPYVELDFTTLGTGVRPELEMNTWLDPIMVNAVCEQFIVTLKQDGHVWEITFRQGETEKALALIRPMTAGEETGMTVTLKPDFSVLEKNDFDYEVLSWYLREVAFLVSSLEIVLEDQRPAHEHRVRRFHYPDGLAAYVTHLNEKYDTVHPVCSAKMMREVEIRGHVHPMRIEVALQYVEQADSLQLMFINGTEVQETNAPMSKFIELLEQHINGFAFRSGRVRGDKGNFSPNDMMNGLTAVLQVWSPANMIHVFHSTHIHEGYSLGAMIHDTTVEKVGEVVEDMMVYLPSINEDTMSRIVERVMRSKAQLRQRRFSQLND